jgi:ribosomal protein S27AE
MPEDPRSCWTCLLRQRIAELPPGPDPSGEADRDGGARRALILVLEPGASDLPARPDSPAEGLLLHSVDRCPNCGEECSVPSSPYCTPRCREEAAFVRQLRGAVASGWDPERQIALGEKLWRILGGGYPRRVARVEARSLERILERKGRRCEECGGQATMVDHLGSG